MDTVTVHYWPTEAQGYLSIQPLTIFLTMTLLFSSCTTLMLCTSVWTNHWENMEWDFQEVRYKNSTKTNLEKFAYDAIYIHIFFRQYQFWKHKTNHPNG